MKKMIVAAALLAVTSVQAEELKYGDLNYFIPAGKLNLSAAVDSRSEEQRVANVTSEQEGWFIDTLLTYGVGDKLNLFAGLNYQYNVQVSSETAPSEARFNQDGLANPVLGGIFRLQSQKDGAAFNLDFGALARVRVMDAKTGSTVGRDDKNGNAADGRHSVEVFARIGQKWNEANEWQFSAGAIRHLDGESKLVSASGDTDFDEDASTDAYVKAAYQWRPVNEFMMGLSLTATQVGKFTSEDEANSKTRLNSHTDYALDYLAKYLVTENMIARFDFRWANNRNYKGNSNGTTFDVDKRKESRIGLGVDYLF